MIPQSLVILYALVIDQHSEYIQALWHHCIVWHLLGRQTNLKISWDLSILLNSTLNCKWCAAMLVGAGFRALRCCFSKRNMLDKHPSLGLMTPGGDREPSIVALGPMLCLPVHSNQRAAVLPPLACDWSMLHAWPMWYRQAPQYWTRVIWTQHLLSRVAIYCMHIAYLCGGHH